MSVTLLCVLKPSGLRQHRILVLTLGGHLVKANLDTALITGVRPRSGGVIFNSLRVDKAATRSGHQI